MYKATGWALAVTLAMVGIAGAAVVTSENFSLGYGYTSGGWDTSETAATNTPTVQGDFTFTPTVNGTIWSGGGWFFPNRVPTDSGPGGYGCEGPTFNVSVNATYAGAAQPEGELTLVITKISIYGTSWTYLPEVGGGEFGFVETTGGQSVAGPTAVLPPTWINVEGSTADRNIANYAQTVWDPTDVAVAGESATRTFSLATTSTYLAIDGFEIEGYVQYESVPEPMTLLLLTTGGLAMLRKRL